jgi:peptidoglycan/LPS O-acetylase OafA/YrhL
MQFFPALHGMRGLAALAVLLFHWKGSFPKVSMDLKEVRFLGTEWDLFLFIDLGWNGVHWFFVLSGFLLASQLMHSQLDGQAIGRFWQRRLVRIYPAVWLQLSLLLPFTWLVGLAGSLGWFQVLANYLLWPAALGGAPFYNGVYWTLPLELSFYLLLPFIVLLHRRIGFWPVIALAMLITVAWRLNIIWEHEARNAARVQASALRNLLPGMLAIFMAGYAVTRFPQNLSNRSRYGWLVVVLAIYVAWHMLVRYAMNTGFDQSLWMMLFWEIGLAGIIALIIGLLLRPLWGFGWLAWRPLTWLGDLSYGIYLWHFPVLRLLPKLFPGDWHSTSGSLLALAICIVVTLPLAMASYHWVERPLMDFIARRQQHRRSLQPA